MWLLSQFYRAVLCWLWSCFIVDSDLAAFICAQEIFTEIKGHSGDTAQWLVTESDNGFVFKQHKKQSHQKLLYIEIENTEYWFCILYFVLIYTLLAVIPVLQTERIGTYGASILMDTAFGLPLSFSAPVAPFFSCIWHSLRFFPSIVTPMALWPWLWLTRNNPWLSMNLYAKFGPDRPGWLPVSNIQTRARSAKCV